MKCQFLTLKSITERYDIIEQIGKGSYGEVCKYRDKVTGEILAIKQMKVLTKDNGFLLSSIRELDILSNFKHENFIQLRAIIQTPNILYLALEYCEYDLSSLLYRKDEVSLSNNQILSYCKQLLLSLIMCQRMNIVHRDLKPANLFITKDNVLKLGDFGLARYLIPKDQIYSEYNPKNIKYSNNVITIYYRPPELLLGSTFYGSEVDIWSAGCIIYEILTRRPLFPTKETTHVSQLKTIFDLCGTPDISKWANYKRFDPKIVRLFTLMKGKNNCDASQGKLKEFFEKTISPEFQGIIPLLLEMLQLDGSKRITAEQAFCNDFFQISSIEPSQLQTLAFKEIHHISVRDERKKREYESIAIREAILHS